MTTAYFIEELKTKFPFKKQSKNFALIKLEEDQLLAFNNTIEIKAINYLKVNNKTLGFRMDRVLDLESTNELLCVSGTETKDGLYYLDHESILITVEEVENKHDTKMWIEEWLGIDIKEYTKLSPDKKMSLFEKEVGIRLVTKTFEAFLEKISIVSKADFYKKGK